MKKASILLVMIIALSIVMRTNAITVCAQDEQVISGKEYKFNNDNDYKFSVGGYIGKIPNGSQYGTLSLKGDYKKLSDKNGFAAYEVSSGNIELNYLLAWNLKFAAQKDWHLTEDKSQKVNDINLDSQILTGAIIVQSSFDGNKWATDDVYTNITESSSSFRTMFYQTKNIQQINGCYYRIIVVYELEKLVEERVVLGINYNKYDYERYAEVYQFYVINKAELLGNDVSFNSSPSKVLGQKTGTGLDNGYAGSEAITVKDPHYGWEIGNFTVNGYTREYNSNDQSPVFLKNVGDKVTLWFTLKQDIDMLNGNSDLCINEDKNGYDQYFEIPKTNFKHGTLIIRFTDHEGVKHDPVIYTDFLAANTKTGANTKVELFEEGDYEVALDYEIVNKKIINSYSNYRIYFTFSIRNGNCMVFPFDIKTGDELQNGSITSDGFKLDMAKSRYLTIDVERKEIKKNEAGQYYEDTRFNRPAKDGTEYRDDGIYYFTVKNLYTGESTQKVVFVGSNAVSLAMSVQHMSLDEINDALKEGAVLEQDGTMTYPKLTPTSATSDSQDDNKKTSTDESESNEESRFENEEKTKSVVPYIVGAVLFVLVGTGAFVGYKKITKKKTYFTDEEIDKE